jgi:hypothetical protein
MSHAAPVIIQVSRDEVSRIETARVSSILASFLPMLLKRNRNRVQIEVAGYETDSRELFDIEEVRAYFQALFDENPAQGLFYWIDLESYMFIFLGLMLFKPDRIEGKVGLAPSDLQAYLVRGFSGLKSFCSATGTSPDSTNASIRAILNCQDT